MKALRRSGLIAGMLVFLTGCIAPLNKQILPAFKCDAPEPAIDLGTADGRYYAHWVDAGRVAVLRVAPYGMSFLGTDEFKDMEHVEDVWVVDMRTRVSKKVDKAWSDALMEQLRRTKWAFKIDVGGSIASGIGAALSGGLSKGANYFNGTLVQPDGTQVSYRAGLRSGSSSSVRLVTQFGDSGDLYVGQPKGGYQTAMLGVQISPDGRFIKSDMFLVEPKTGRRVQMFTAACTDMSGVVVDPSWRFAAMVFEKDGHHKVAFSPFSADSAW